MFQGFKDRPLGFKILTGGISSILLLAVLLFTVGSYFLGQYRTADQVSKLSDDININLLEARRNEKDFLLRDLNNPLFFQTGKSDNLDLFKEHIARFNQEVKNLEVLQHQGSKRGEELGKLGGKFDVGF